MTNWTLDTRKECMYKNKVGKIKILPCVGTIDRYDIVLKNYQIVVARDEFLEMGPSVQKMELAGGSQNTAKERSKCAPETKSGMPISTASAKKETFPSRQIAARRVV